MNLNDPKVRQRVIGHVQFAIQTTNAALGVEKLSENPTVVSDTEKQMVMALAQAVQSPIIVALLNYTISRDYELSNTLQGAAKTLKNKKGERSK